MVVLVRKDNYKDRKAVKGHCSITTIYYSQNVEGSSFPDLVTSDDGVNSDSVMGIKPGDSGVVIG